MRRKLADFKVVDIQFRSRMWPAGPPETRPPRSSHFLLPSLFKGHACQACVAVKQAFDPPRSPLARPPFSSPTMTHYGRAVCCRPFISDEKWIWPTVACTPLAFSLRPPFSLSGKTTMTTPHFKIRAPSHLPPSLPSSLGSCINDV